MKERFETFVTAITQIYRCLQKLKNQEMADFGLRGSHVMCLYQLSCHEDGLTPARLAQLCEEDKAAVSRAVAELKDLGLICTSAEPKKYRRHLLLTDRGREVTEIMDRKIIDAVLTAAQGYGPEERKIFYGVLLQVAENLRNACEAREESL